MQKSASGILAGINGDDSNCPCREVGLFIRLSALDRVCEKAEFSSEYVEKINLLRPKYKKFFKTIASIGAS